MASRHSIEVTRGATIEEPIGLIGSPVVRETEDVDKPFPTDEEFSVLPKVPGEIPWTAWTVAIVEFAERFSFYGTTAVCTSCDQVAARNARY